MKMKAKILIVDDEQINLDFFDVMLSRLGFQVEKAEDGEEALEKVRDFKPDLVILDNIMPKLSGWEVTKILKNDEQYDAFKDIPIIMFSALDDVKDKIEGYELGVEDYITKPFNFSEVLARIKAVLRHRMLSNQVLQRERRIALIESLNKSLTYFTEHLKKPTLEMLNAASTLEIGNPQAVREFIRMVKDESEATLASLDGLEEEIQDLRSRQDTMKKNEIQLEELEEKYQKHATVWKEKQSASYGG